MSTLGQEFVQSAKEALAIARGEMTPARVVAPADIDVAALRKRLGMSQARFGKRFNIAPATIRDWEQGRRRPDTIARTLLTIIDREPEAVQRALEDA